MKRSIFIVITTIILLISKTFPTNVFAAPISTTTITSVKAENKTISGRKEQTLQAIRFRWQQIRSLRKMLKLLL